jgi:hypothetical protein
VWATAFGATSGFDTRFAEAAGEDVDLGFRFNGSSAISLTLQLQS